MTIIAFFIDNWREFAKKHNGILRNSKTGASPLGFGMSSWKKVYLRIPYRSSEIVFETGEATRMQIYFDFKKDIKYNFLIYPEDYADKISKFLRISKEVEILDKQFDESFFIKTDNKDFILQFLNQDIKSYLLRHKKRISNYKLEKEKETTILRLNSPFDENNINHMEHVLTFMKHSIDNILDRKIN